MGGGARPQGSWAAGGSCSVEEDRGRRVKGKKRKKKEKGKRKEVRE
jgi:hypothetical protein